MKITRNKKRKLFEAVSFGSYYAIINHDRQEDTREFEVIHGPVTEVIDYVAEQAAAFLVDYLGADNSFYVFPVSPRIATELSGSDQKRINDTVEEIMEYREAIVDIDGCNASDWVIDYINDTETDPEAVLEDPNFDVVEVSETPAYKTWVVKDLKRDITFDFNKYSE